MMKLSVELSMYPLDRDYLIPIRAFIERLNTYDDLQVTTGAMSTLVTGEYERVFDVLRVEMRRAHQEHGLAVFVAKCIPGYTAGEDDAGA